MEQPKPISGLERFRAMYPKRRNTVRYVGGPRDGKSIVLDHTTNMITCGDDAKAKGMHGVYYVKYADVWKSDGVATWRELPPPRGPLR